MNYEKEYPVKVIIDENISVNLSVKSEMTALEFLGLTTKVNQLFKVSNKMIAVESESKSSVSKRAKWNKEMEDKLKQMYRTATFEEMTEALNVTREQLYNKIHTMGLNKKFTCKDNKVEKKFWTTDKIQTVIKMKKQGKSSNQISEKLGIKDKRKTWDLIYKLNKEGKL